MSARAQPAAGPGARLTSAHFPAVAAHAYARRSGSEFYGTFMMTLQTFTDPVTFVEKLIERYIVRWGTWAGGPGPGKGVQIWKGVDHC